MRTKMLTTVTAGVLLLTAAAVWWGVAGGQNTSLANPGVTVGVDTDPTGNTATSLGAIQTSRTVACGDTFDVDIYVRDVTDLISWHVLLRYNKDIIRPTARNVQMFLAAAPGSDVGDHSLGDPAFAGVYELQAADDVAPESGTGVLARLTITALAPGTTTLTLEDPFFIGAPFSQIPIDPMLGAEITVSEGACPPDTDGDGWPDPVDNCPLVPNPDRADNDRDGLGDVCDDDDDNDTVLDQDDNCPLKANADQADADGDGVGNVCDPTPGTPTPTPSPTPLPSPTPGTPTPGTPTPGTPTPGAGTPTPTPPPGATVLVSGWNNPCYAGPEQAIEDALADVAGNVMAVYRMRADQGFDRWFPNRPDVSTISSVSPYQSLFLLVDQWVYWMQPSSGTPPTFVSLAHGWNSVCYAGQPEDIQEATATIVEQIGVLYALTPNQSWDRYVPDRPDVSNLDRLESPSAVIVLINSGDAVWAFDA
jgi:hypothetical protein